MNRRILIVALVLPVSFAIGADASFLDVFPPSPAQPGDPKGWQLTMTRDFVASGSQWAEGLEERDVFHALLKHEQNKDCDWELRLGKGGQIYSLRGPFGEAIAPNWRRSYDERAPWVDDVIQAVAVSSARQDRDKSGGARSMQRAFFIHQAGVYPREKEYLPQGTFYSPMLAEAWNPGERSFAMLTWGQQAHIPSVHKSGALYYEKLRDLGDGAIEVTYVIYNFGADTLDYLNLPWGGFRRTSLPVLLLSRPDGTAGSAEARFGSDSDNVGIVDTAKTGGWIAFAQEGARPGGHALALVFGADRHLASQTALKEAGKPFFQLGPARLRYGQAGAPDVTKDQRNLIVATNIARCAIRPGSAFFFRLYLIAGPLEQVESRARQLAGAVDYGPLEFTAEDPPLVSVYRTRIDGQPALVARSDADGAAGSAPAFLAYARPVKDAAPLFLLHDTLAHRYIVSFDPYQLCGTEPYQNPFPAGDPKHDTYANRVVYRPYDGRTRYAGFLGFALSGGSADAAVAETILLSAAVGDPGLYPQPSAAHRSIRVRAAQPRSPAPNDN